MHGQRQGAASRKEGSCKGELCTRSGPALELPDELLFPVAAGWLGDDWLLEDA